LDLVKKHVDTSAAEAKRKAENYMHKNLATESKLEEERKTRLEMEAAIAPRLIDQQKAAEELKLLLVCQ